MNKDISNQIPSDSQGGDEEKPFFKSADSFFHKPAGTFLICILIFGLTVWAFAPALKTDFQFYDENGELGMNAHMRSGLSWHNLRWALSSLEYSNWYPLTWISHMLDFKMFGENAWGHHLTNILLHATNAILLFLVLKRMTRALWRSLVVAALFALHPLRVESVAWITERKDVLCAFFGLLALWTYARHVQKSEVRSQKSGTNLPTSSFFLISPFYWLSLLFFAFGLMSKSMLVTFPCLLLLLDFWPLQRISQFRIPNSELKCLLLEKVPFVLLIVPVSVATYFAQKAGDQFMFHFPPGFRMETVLMGYGRYLEKMVWPSNLSVLYPYPAFWRVGQLLCAAVVVFGITAVTIALWWRRPYLPVGWLWYLVTLVPVIGFLPLGAQSMSNRYSYMPMIGILVLLVWAIEDLSKRWRQRAILMATAVALILGVCILRTRAEIVYWKNGETLWTRAVAVTTNNFMAHYCLATIVGTTKPREALAEYQESVDIYPEFFNAELGLGFQLQFDGRFSEAIPHLEKAIQIRPQSSWGYGDLGSVLLKMGRAKDAVSPLLTALELDPHNPDHNGALNQALFSSEHETDAVSNFLATVRSDPAGFENYLEAMQSDTNHVVLINNLAWSFATFPDPKLRNGKYAVRLATRACEMTGFRINNFVVTVAVADAEDSRFDNAIANAQIACSLASAAGNADLLKNYQAMLELFRSHQQYHEPVR
jgi:hypothetical protein